MENFFATCPRGLEPLLAEELRQLKAEKIHAVGGGVGFGGDFLLCYRVNLESRIASRVLWQVSNRRLPQRRRYLPRRLLAAMDRLV